MSGRAADGETDVNGLDGEGNIRALGFHFQAGGLEEARVCGEWFGCSFEGCWRRWDPILTVFCFAGAIASGILTATI